MSYRIGFCQFKPSLLKPEENLNRMELLLKDIRADLIVLPELATSGYLFTAHDQVKSVSEPAQTGPTASLFRKLAESSNTSYVCGFPEVSEGRFYNSAMLVNPDGKISVYRKIHLFYEEKKWFTPGDNNYRVLSAKNGIKVGLMICFDWIFPEAARSLALLGAQIIAHPANLVLPWCQQAMLTRSLENRVFTVTANRTGFEQQDTKKLKFTGMSQITSPKGEIIVRAEDNEETVIIRDIDPASALDKNVTDYNDILADRRPELYHL